MGASETFDDNGIFTVEATVSDCPVGTFDITVSGCEAAAPPPGVPENTIYRSGDSLRVPLPAFPRGRYTLDGTPVADAVALSRSGTDT